MFFNKYILSLLLLYSYNYLIAGDFKKWILPKDSCFFEQWRNESNTKFLFCIEDFNDDGFCDTARIMESNIDYNCGIFIYWGSKNRTNISNCIFNFNENFFNLGLDSNTVKDEQRRYRYNYGIKIVEKGYYQTACGKGYYECEPGEPKVIFLHFPGIEFFEYDAGDIKYFYWDSTQKKFTMQQISE